ncbi:hypothetical protein L596_015880 [Steinernema carpocapsae]|uniref:Uncharacterized protein n=1 Tax=Steinernema carpocapsae TaxID=34508 RepID=A0A4U5NGC5_STECR|nr:hypothetical protein L596_015880 [Steinernema carpocapsae]
MMQARGYTVHRNVDDVDEDDERYQCCCGVFHIVTGAKIISVFLLLFALGIVFFNHTIYSESSPETDFSVVLYIIDVIVLGYVGILCFGVFSGRRTFLLPFIIFQTITTAIFSLVLVCYAVLGSITNFIRDQHNNEELRELYKMHGLNASDEKIQTIVSCSILFALLVICVGLIYTWTVFYFTYSYMKSKDACRAVESGYKRARISAA